MKHIICSTYCWLFSRQSDRGSTATEYAIIVSLIAGVIGAVVGAVGGSTSENFVGVNDALLAVRT